MMTVDFGVANIFYNFSTLYCNIYLLVNTVESLIVGINSRKRVHFLIKVVTNILIPVVLNIRYCQQINISF